MRRAVHMLVVVALLSAAGCAVAAEPGWERQLERLVGTRDGAPVDAAAFVTPRPDADPAVGDGVTFDVRLEDGERARTWRLGLGIVRVETAEMVVCDQRSELPMARVSVAAFDASGEQVGLGESDVIVARLREGSGSRK